MTAVQWVGAVCVTAAVLFFGTVLLVLWAAARYDRRNMDGGCPCAGCRSIVEVIR